MIKFLIPQRKVNITKGTDSFTILIFVELFCKSKNKRNKNSSTPNGLICKENVLINKINKYYKFVYLFSKMSVVAM